MNESQHIEWKPCWRDEYLKWICGFANADGAAPLIGKDDTGRSHIRRVWHRKGAICAGIREL